MNKEKNMKKHCNCNMKGFIKAAILLILASGKSYGYTLQKTIIEKDLRDTVDIASIYRNLNSLEEHGYIKASWQESETGPDKKMYAITEDGKILLDNWIIALSDKKKRIETFISIYDSLQ